jgi:dihydropteroate synthase
MNNRKRFEWKVRERTLLLGERTLILGVLNVTPDSFSDGGRYSDPEVAYARAMELEEHGADILDIGAESTRPGSPRISEAEELRRLIPVLKRLKGKLNIPISIDTYKSGVAEKALEHEAHIINDPSGLTFDPLLARTAANHNAGLILNHMRGTPESWAKLGPMPNVMGAIFDDLDATVHRAVASGVERSRIMIDPGLGFGKRKEQNAEILARLHELARLELPILIGPSRKSFLAPAVVGQMFEDEADFATAAAATCGILEGAHMIRVHNVKGLKVVAQIVDQVIAAAQAPEPPPPPKPLVRRRTDELTGPPRKALRPQLRRKPDLGPTR